MGPITGEHIVENMFKAFGKELGRAIRRHSVLRPFMEGRVAGDGMSLSERLSSYVAFLLVTEGYVHDTVPLLRASGLALANGDGEDGRWSNVFLENAEEETDPHGRYGHDRWAYDDRKHVLGLLNPRVAQPILRLPPPAVATSGLYHRFMVVDAAKHPYSGLGAKGVFEHLALDIADECTLGLRTSFPNISPRPTAVPSDDHGVTLIAQHGILDLEHTLTGNERVKSIRESAKLEQIAMGAEVARAAYHCFIFAMSELADEIVKSIGEGAHDVTRTAA